MDKRCKRTLTFFSLNDVRQFYLDATIESEGISQVLWYNQEMAGLKVYWCLIRHFLLSEWGDSEWCKH